MENQTLNSSIQTPNSASKTHHVKMKKVFVAFLIVLLIASTSVFAYLWKNENTKVKKYKQAAIITNEFAKAVNDDVYNQFKLVDERGHWISTITCGEIVASNNYQETKPEYVRMVKNGICSPFSDVYKPNYTAFTGKLQEKSTAINSIYHELGIQTIPTFEGKKNTNYLFDTCWDIIEVGQCDINTTF